MNTQTLSQHAIDVLKAALAVLLVQFAVVVLKDLQVLIPGWLNFLGSTAAGTVAIKANLTKLMA